MMRTHPELLQALRDEFGRGPLSEETLQQVEARLRELEPARELSVVTLGGALMGVCEGVFGP